MHVNPYDDRKVTLPRPHGNGDLDIVRTSYTRHKANVTESLATIIPIPKPGKDLRLRFLESNNHISRFQSGFRSDPSTTDNLVRLETFIRDAFIKKEHVVAVFFLFGKSL